MSFSDINFGLKRNLFWDIFTSYISTYEPVYQADLSDKDKYSKYKRRDLSQLVGIELEKGDVLT